MPTTFWKRDQNGARVQDTYYSQSEVDEMVAGLPYFGLAAQRVLTEKNNTASFPQSMTQLRNQDNVFIQSGAYDGLSERERADLLAETAALNLGFDLS